MSAACIYCSAAILSSETENRFITHDVCSECIDNITSQDDLLISFLDNIESPVLLMQQDPGQVRTANKKACDLFDKDLSQIERHRGGHVFDCVHAFTEAGCGVDKNCEDCGIRDCVIETFKSGKSFKEVSEILNVKKNNLTEPYHVQISTEKVGDLALIRIDIYHKVI